MVIKSFLAIILVISPLFRASWDLWAQTLIHLLTLFVLLSLIFSKSCDSEKSQFTTPLYHHTTLPLFIFVLFCFISIFSSANFYESRNEFFNILNYVVIFYFAKNVKKNHIFVPVLISGIILSLYGFYQKIFTGGNIPSFMNNPNIFAGYLAGLICLTFGLLIKSMPKQPKPATAGSEIDPNNRTNVRELKTETRRSGFGNKKIYFLLLLIFIIALFFTGSISAWLAVVFGISVFLYLGKIYIPKKYILFAAGIFIIFLLVKILEKESFNRILWWMAAGKMILAEPFTGVGLSAYADAYHKFKLSGLNSIYAHNYFLQTAAEIGIFGFLALILFFIKIFKLKKTKDTIPFFAAAAAMLFHGLFDYSLLIPANAIFFWVLLGFASKNDLAFSVKLPHPEFFGARNDTKVSIFRWVSVFLVVAGIYYSVKIFLGSRETAQGKHYLNEKKLDIAQTHLKKSLQYDRYNPQTYFYLSNIYQQYFKVTGYQTYLDEAEIELKKVIKLQKYNSQIYFDLYSIRYLRGDTKDALNWLKKTRETSPKSVFYEKCYQVFLKEIYKKK